MRGHSRGRGSQEGLDPKESVRSKEPLMDNVPSREALINLPEGKTIMTKAELPEEIRKPGDKQKR